MVVREPIPTSLNDLIKGYVPDGRYIAVEGVINDPYILDSHRFTAMIGPSWWQRIPLMEGLATTKEQEILVKNLKYRSQFPIIGSMSEEIDTASEMQVLKDNSYAPTILWGRYVQTNQTGFIYAVQMKVGNQVFKHFDDDEELFNVKELMVVLNSLPN